MKNGLLYSSVLSVLLLSSGALVAQNNLLVNPGFEEGTQNDAPPWAVGGWRGSDRATTDEHHSGRRSLQMQGGGDEDNINSFLQWVPIDPTGATKYHFKVWMKIPSATADAPQSGRTRWIMDNGSPSDGVVTPIDNPDWTQIDSADKDIIPSPGSQFMCFRTYALTGRLTAYVDDVELTSEPSGQPTYPGVTGIVKDQNGKPLAGAIVFLKSSPKAQEFAADATGNGGASAPTDDAGKFTVCTKDPGTYYVVAWKRGYGLSAEEQVTIAGGAALATFNPVLTKSSSGRNLAISTAARPTAFAAINVGFLDDPQYVLSNMFDGNNITSRYENRASEEPSAQRWVYVDLDPVGKKTFSVNEFVLYGVGITGATQGSTGGEGTPKNFTIEYTTKDPATETEAGWTANTAFTVTDAVPTLGPSVMRITNAITARAVRFHVPATDPVAAWFGPVEFQVNSDTLAQGSITGVVKDATTGTPIAGAAVSLFQPIHIQNDADVYGLGTPVPFVVAEEVRNGTPYEFDQAKNTQQIAVTDATGTYTLDADAGQTVRVSVRVTGYPYTVASVTPPDDGSAATQNFNLGKEYIVSGVVKDATGPIYNALVQIGGASSKYAVVTGTDGKYSLAVGAGSQEVYADAYGHAGHVETINVAADVAKDITLTTQAEPGSLNADFETLGDWEIGHFDTNWVSVGIGTRAAKVDGGQNTTPGGKSSALVEDIKSVDNANTELTDPTYEMLQRPSSKRIAVTAGNSYNVYFKLKIENWVITDTTKDCVHYEIRWLDANGAVLDRVYSHPFWIFPQTFWQQYSVGHPAGSDGSVALVRLSPPAGAAFLDLKIGWIRFNSGIDDANPDPGINPAGTQLFVDDLVVDSFGAGGGGAAPTISATKDPGGIKITWTGTLESADAVTGTWTAVPGATSPLTVKTDPTQRFYRSRSQ